MVYSIGYRGKTQIHLQSIQRPITRPRKTRIHRFLVKASPAIIHTIKHKMFKKIKLRATVQKLSSYSLREISDRKTALHSKDNLTMRRSLAKVLVLVRRVISLTFTLLRIKYLRNLVKYHSSKSSLKIL